MCEMVCQIVQKNQEEKRIEEEQAANAQYWKIPACCDDDDDHNSAITPNEPVDSLSMGDEYLNTIPATESNEFIKSCVENIIPNPNDDDSERDILIREKLLDNYSLLLLVIESYQFDIPSFSRPSAKPPDGNTGILNIKMMGNKN
nr:hypothetical protein [Tanacetum cinerariifolium]